MSASQLSSIEDFTTAHYTELLRLAKLKYKFSGYREVVAGERFVLWRHDCDYSLDRSLRLAELEHQEAVKATYFLNPHCEFYNLLEQGQTRIIEKILALGHDIGLHFDAAYHHVAFEDNLDELIEREAGWLNDWFGIDPVAFSFHNPTEFLLSCERDSYGGLINCYSRTFRATIPYCSDSNGYWRFRRLRDVLESAQDPCLQVLTHPGWWQETPLYPRERIFRSVYGRADAIMNSYDATLAAHGRENLAGPAGNLGFLKEIDARRFQRYDYLWNRRMFRSLFVELYCLYQSQIERLCRAMLRNVLGIPISYIDAFFMDEKITIDGWRLFEAVFEKAWTEASGYSDEEHRHWLELSNRLIHGSAHIPSGSIEGACIYLCGVIKNVSRWGLAQEEIRHDGIMCAGGASGAGVKEHGPELGSFDVKKWEDLKVRARKIQNY